MKYIKCNYRETPWEDCPDDGKFVANTNGFLFVCHFHARQLKDTYEFSWVGKKEFSIRFK